jgi:RNA polymerase sigma-70 factor (ECF subfamily)
MHIVSAQVLEKWSAMADEDVVDRAFSGEIRGLLEWVIDGLPSGAREVFVLRDVEGLSTAETAAVLDVSEDVVKTRLSRARAALRRVLTQRVGQSTPDVFRFYRPRCDRVVERVMESIGGIAPSGPIASGRDDAVSRR